MTTLSTDRKKRMLEETRPAAISFVEDMEYLRELVAKVTTNRGELRRLSAVLRRLLVEGDIGTIAAPRIGRIKLRAPDNKEIYKLPAQLKVLFFYGGGASVFGFSLSSQLMLNAGQATNPEAQGAVVRDALSDYDPAGSIELRLDNFLSQRVLCWRGMWATRRAIIKHIANVASGVHSGALATEDDAIIDKMRASAHYTVVDGKLAVHILPEFGPDSAQLTYTPTAELPQSFSASSLDPVLVELLVTAKLLAESPDVIDLERAVINECVAHGLVARD
ncbi:MAG: hypothetical protein J0H65_17155 [Rhizobiales bacterium]|nr:hypothetical protein [Hyphomicrobiales bacterium]